MSEAIEKSISDFLNEEVKEFSVHVLKERALPSVIDGLKPSARKIIYTAEKNYRKKKKTISLVGDSISIGGYDKGDTALPGIIATLTQDFPGANNIPYLKGFGEFGTRKVPNGVAAPRYTEIQLHQNFDRFFMDKELFEYDDNHDKYEPKYFLPVIPTILLNHISGIAVGFACEFQPYNVQDIIENVLLAIDGKKLKDMIPYYEGYTGLIFEYDGKWFIEGIIEKTSTHQWTIKEVPVGISREQYIDHLEKLIDRGTIRDYTEHIGDGFYFDIALSREQCAKLNAMDEEKLLKTFKLQSSLNENLNCISENNSLLQFSNVNEIIEHFVKFRLALMTKRKNYKINNLTERIGLIEAKIKFVRLVLEGKLSLTKLLNKDDLRQRTLNADNGLKGYVEQLIGIPVYNITKAYENELKALLPDLNKDLKYYQTVTETKLYKEDLKNF